MSMQSTIPACVWWLAKNILYATPVNKNTQMYPRRNSCCREIISCNPQCASLLRRSLFSFITHILQQKTRGYKSLNQILFKIVLCRFLIFPWFYHSDYLLPLIVNGYLLKNVLEWTKFSPLCLNCPEVIFKSETKYL